MRSLYMGKAVWKKYKFILERGAEVYEELLVAARDEKHAWHLGLAKAMQEGFRDLVDSRDVLVRVEEIA